MPEAPVNDGDNYNRPKVRHVLLNLSRFGEGLGRL